MKYHTLAPADKVLQMETQFLESLELVSDTLNKAKDVDNIVDVVLEVILNLFDCDRAWLLHPCDPNAKHVDIFAEKTKKKYPGALSTGQAVPITDESALVIQKTLDSAFPVTFGANSENELDDITSRYSVLSLITMAIYPKTEKPWMLGMHQCSYPRNWSHYEQLLFKEISFRVVETLSNHILLENLKKSELKYRRFFTTIRNGWAYHKTIFDHNNIPVDYVFLETNQAFEKLTGLKPAAIIGRKVSEVVKDDPDLLHDWINNFGQISLTGQGRTFEGYIKKTNKWYSVSVSSLTHGYFITVFEDISGQKIAQEKLKRSEERCTLALQAANVGTWDWNLKTGQIICSDQVQSIFAMPSKEVCSSFDNFIKHIHPEDRQYVRNTIEYALEHNNDYDIEHRIIRPDNSIRWVAEKGNIFRDNEGNTTRMLGVFLDISERMEAFERFRTVLDSLDSLVYVADIHSHELLFINKIGRKRWGDIVGKICWETLQEGQSGPCPFCTNDRIIDTDNKPKEPCVWEFQNKSTNQWYECRDQAIHWPDGRIVRLEIATNITQRKEGEEKRVILENKLRQSQKMEAIGTLAGGIAHDFNNILSIILGYSEMARDDCPHASMIATKLDEVIHAGHRAKNLVRQILTFSRQTHAKRIPLQITPIIKEAVKMLRSSIPATIEINLTIEQELDVICADPTQIHQVLMNLCTNSFHAMEKTGGNLDITLQNIHLNSADLRKEPHIPPGDFIQLSVKDSGKGIAHEMQEKIFDPYFTTKTAEKGTGLGLSVVHGIISSYEGLIKIESSPGLGSTFHIYFPTCKDTDERQADEADSIPEGKETILLVDDEYQVRDVVANMLERLGYTVISCHSSQEALHLFEQRPKQFDVVITDQTMPEMTGAELAKKLLAIEPELPIILCTGYSSIITEDEAHAIGIKEYTIKPFQKAEIATLIRGLLDEKARRPYRD